MPSPSAHPITYSALNWAFLCHRNGAYQLHCSSWPFQILSFLMNLLQVGTCSLLILRASICKQLAILHCCRSRRKIGTWSAKIFECVSPSWEPWRMRESCYSHHSPAQKWNIPHVSQTTVAFWRKGTPYLECSQKKYLTSYHCSILVQPYTQDCIIKNVKDMVTKSLTMLTCW